MLIQQRFPFCHSGNVNGKQNLTKGIPGINQDLPHEWERCFAWMECDPQTLGLHAAARLRKTGYYEQIRGDVPNLSDGRVDGSHERVSNGNRPYGSQLNQLERDPPREQVYAAPTHSYHTDSIGNVRGNSHSSVTNQNTVEPMLPSSFDAVPKNLYQTFNNPSSKSFIENKLEPPLPASHRPTPTFQTYTAPIRTVQHSPHRNVFNASPRPYTPPTQHETQSSHHTSSYIQEPIAYAPPHYDSKPYAPRPYSPRSHSAQYSSAPEQENSSYNYQTYTKETTRREEQQKTRPSTVQWETPYVRAPSPILDPHARIREFATNTYVEPEPPRSQEYVHTVRRETHTTRNAPNDFATTLRNQGLTASQREANQHQASTLRRDNLPFNADHIYKQSYCGDEVDRLVSNMQTEMHVTRTQVPPTSATSTICASCQQPVSGTNPGCTALNQIFHISCFKCKTCGKTLAGTSFYNIDNNPTCSDCYNDTLESCTKCQQKITDRLLRAHGGVWHVNCFTCESCNRSLDGIPFTSDPKDNVYCVNCYQEKFAPRCAVCNKPIVPVEGEKESVRVIAMDKSFHPGCYKCEDCGMQLSSKVEGAGCYPLNDHLYCKTCNMNRLRAGQPA
ncbi:LIM domain protein [Teladorsagia circumcincta]|uniref:LIM domain protein n=3 Tax=Teladorsagia circumcincta TaxID=45464 RepID=A0A2G9UQ74_TELCI|nr:LIM domain protein [Teladorsagia circumcincta]